MSGQWEPSASLEQLQLRAAMLDRIRRFFAARGVLEVETPLLGRATVTDPHIDSLSVNTTPSTRYLQTSPEFAMKRLLAAGVGDIYQVCKAFRVDPAARFHNPEFTLLEWYRVGLDHHALMDEVEALLEFTIGDALTVNSAQRLTYREAFCQHARLDPSTVSEAECRAVAQTQGLRVEGHMSRDDWLDVLMASVVAPKFEPDRFTFLYDYPGSRAALARTRVEDGQVVAERFELFWGALELANGFHELSDAREQRRRFERDIRTRTAARQSRPPMDEALLSALTAGLPECSGVALGLDRLLMIIGGVAHIEQTLSFDWERA